jgi:hypothetical protein
MKETAGTVECRSDDPDTRSCSSGNPRDRRGRIGYFPNITSRRHRRKADGPPLTMLRSRVTIDWKNFNRGLPRSEELFAGEVDIGYIVRTSHQRVYKSGGDVV